MAVSTATSGERWWIFVARTCTWWSTIVWMRIEYKDTRENINKYKLTEYHYCIVEKIIDKYLLDAVNIQCSVRPTDDSLSKSRISSSRDLVNEGRKREKLRKGRTVHTLQVKASLKRTPSFLMLCLSPTIPSPPTVSNKGRLFRFPSHSIVGRAVSHTTVVAFALIASYLIFVLCLHLDLFSFFSPRDWVVYFP